VKDLYEVCKVLNITVEYLITGKPPESIPLEILSVARKICGLGEKDRKAMLALLNSFVEGQESESPVPPAVS
jgi:hypothetical protein